MLHNCILCIKAYKVEALEYRKFLVWAYNFYLQYSIIQLFPARCSET